MPPKKRAKRAKRAQNDPWGDQPATGPWDQPGEDDPWRLVCCDKAEVSGVSVVSGVPDDGVDPWHTKNQQKTKDHQLGSCNANDSIHVMWQSHN